MFTATLNQDQRQVEVIWDGGERDVFPLVWLRDNCQCNQCYDLDFKARKTHMSDLKPDVSVANIKVDLGVLFINWEDDHLSDYNQDWLYLRRFSSQQQELRARYHGRVPKLWGAELAKNLPKMEFSKILSDDRALYDWITLMEETGFCVLTGAPLQQGQLHKIAQRVAFLRKTNYGETFCVKTKLNPSNVAYTTGTLGLHTDLAYHNVVPGMQMLHCISQTRAEGGENEFVDGFNVAQQIRDKYPDQFKVLTTTSLDYFDLGKDYLEFFQFSHHPTIRVDIRGEICQVVFSNHGRDSFLKLPPDEVEPLYRALILFNKLCYHQENIIRYKMNNGDICCFHNHRVLHGRGGYSPSATEVRQLEGGYIDWDELSSMRRVLKGRLNIPDTEY